MIDARRWILAEAWLSLGLCIRWCPRYESDRVPSEAWQVDDGDDGNRLPFFYEGRGVWLVRDPDERSFGIRRAPLTAPVLSTDSLVHELAHWLTATGEERGLRNFGADDGDQALTEERALDAQPVIDALLTASARVTTLALLGGTRTNERNGT